MPAAVSRRRNGYEHEVEIREHRLIVDEPENRGGGDQGPTPTELLAGSLASCTSATLLMYAERKGWELGQLEVAVSFATPEPGDESASLEVKIRIPAELTDEQREKLLVIAGKCPVHRILAASDVSIDDSLETVPVG